MNDNFDKALFEALKDKSDVNTENEMIHVEFSDEYKKRKQEIIQMAAKKKNNMSGSKRKAVILVAAIVLIFAGAMGVNAWKIREVTYEIVNGGKDSNIYNDNSVRHFGNRLIQIDEIPEGYTVVESDYNQTETHIRFQNHEQYFIVEKYLKSDKEISDKNENTKKIKINENSGVYFERDGENFIEWRVGQTFYVIHGNVTKKFMHDLAKIIV